MFNFRPQYYSGFQLVVITSCCPLVLDLGIYVQVAIICLSSSARVDPSLQLSPAGVHLYYTIGLLVYMYSLPLFRLIVLEWIPACSFCKLLSLGVTVLDFRSICIACHHPIVFQHQSGSQLVVIASFCPFLSRYWTFGVYVQLVTIFLPYSIRVDPTLQLSPAAVPRCYSIESWSICIAFPSSYRARVDPRLQLLLASVPRCYTTGLLVYMYSQSLLLSYSIRGDPRLQLLPAAVPRCYTIGFLVYMYSQSIFLSCSIRVDPRLQLFPAAVPSCHSIGFWSIFIACHYPFTLQQQGVPQFVVIACCCPSLLYYWIVSLYLYSQSLSFHLVILELIPVFSYCQLLSVAFIVSDFWSICIVCHYPLAIQYQGLSQLVVITRFCPLLLQFGIFGLYLFQQLSACIIVLE